MGEDPAASGVRGPHLPLTKDLDIRHDGDPSPNPIQRRQTHLSVTELPFYHSTVFTTPAPGTLESRSEPRMESLHHQGRQEQERQEPRMESYYHQGVEHQKQERQEPRMDSFYHQGVERQKQDRQEPKLESYYHQGVERQYTVIERKDRELHSKSIIGPQNRMKSEGVILDNGPSYNKIGSPSEVNIKVVKKENGFTQRELRQIHENNVLRGKPGAGQDSQDTYDEYGDDYENLIKAGTITEFLKL